MFVAEHTYIYISIYINVAAWCGYAWLSVEQQAIARPEVHCSCIRPRPRHKAKQFERNTSHDRQRQTQIDGLIHYSRWHVCWRGQGASCPVLCVCHNWIKGAQKCWQCCFFQVKHKTGVPILDRIRSLNKWCSPWSNNKSNLLKLLLIWFMSLWVEVFWSTEYVRHPYTMSNNINICYKCANKCGDQSTWRLCSRIDCVAMAAKIELDPEPNRTEQTRPRSRRWMHPFTRTHIICAPQFSGWHTRYGDKPNDEGAGVGRWCYSTGVFPILPVGSATTGRGARKWSHACCVCRIQACIVSPNQPKNDEMLQHPWRLTSGGDQHWQPEKNDRSERHHRTQKMVPVIFLLLFFFVRLFGEAIPFARHTLTHTLYRTPYAANQSAKKERQLREMELQTANGTFIHYWYYYIVKNKCTRKCIIIKQYYHLWGWAFRHRQPSFIVYRFDTWTGSRMHVLVSCVSVSVGRISYYWY